MLGEYMVLESYLRLSSPFIGMAEDWKSRIRAEWKETKNLPRKKKKAKRKHLRLEWDIACYDSFDIEQKYEKPPWYK